MQEIKQADQKKPSGEYERNISLKSGSYFMNVPKPWAKANKLAVGDKLRIVAFEDHLEVWLKEGST